MSDRAAYFAAYREANREKARQTSANWRAADKEREKAMTAAYRMANKDILRERQRIAYRQNRAAWLVRAAAYKRANRDKYRAYNLNRKHRERQGRLSIGILQALFERQAGRCVYCPSVFAESGFQVDHIMPLALGGANVDDNVQLLCPPCNMAKSATHPDEFLCR